MKRRINIAAGLVHQPRLLFLDEPTVGVDPQSRNHIFESVLQLNRERGMSIIYTSHYMEEVELLCNRVAIVDQGRIIALDTIRNLVGMLGGGVIQIGLEQVDDALLAAIRALPAVTDATPVAPTVPPPDVPTMREEHLLKIQSTRSQDALVQLFGLLNDRNAAFTSVEIFDPNLESVFLHLTGKKLRE
jgi:ABC-2 type transport system ATP-binding protein